MPTNNAESVFRTKLDIGSLRQILRSAVGSAELSPIQYDMLDDPADFSILVQKKQRLRLGGEAAIHVYINDEGDHRLVTIVALGDSGFARAMQGHRNSLSLGASRKYAEEVTEAFRQHDSSLRQVG